MRCSKCGANNPATNNFCAKCGNALAKPCAKCGADNPPASDFCGKCGAALSEPAAPMPASPPELASAASGAATAGERRHLTALFSDLVASTSPPHHLTSHDSRRV